jgi:two-component system, OmpR family, phosphate regulon sensor histidine kinase PhoR
MESTKLTAMKPFHPLRISLALFAAAAAAAICLLLRATAGPMALAAGLAGIAVWLAFRPAPLPEIVTIAPTTPPPSAIVAELIEAIDDPILIVSRQVVNHANRAAHKLLGHHIIGEDVRLAIRHPAAAERLAGRTTTATVPEGPIELVGIGERERRWELTAHPIGALGQIIRLSDRTGAYATERMRVDFVANASHELRTPLSTLIGFIETLEDNNAAEDAPTRSRFLKIMAQEAKRMQRLVDDLMSLSRIEADKYSLPDIPLRLEPLIQEVRDSLRTGIVADRDRIVVEAEPETPAVAGDRVQLSQLLHNLIGNAVKYGRAGAPVRVSLAPAPGAMVRLSVTDEGEGIAPEHIPRLTERFYRVDPGRSRGLGGTGLGLSIVKHIVERHRGRLDIESVVGRGTTVSVLLPAARIQPPPRVSSKRNTTVTQGVRQAL